MLKPLYNFLSTDKSNENLISFSDLGLNFNLFSDNTTEPWNQQLLTYTSPSGNSARYMAVCMLLHLCFSYGTIFSVITGNVPCSFFMFYLSFGVTVKVHTFLSITEWGKNLEVIYTV